MKCGRCQRFGHALENCTTEYKSMVGTDAGGIRTLDDVLGRCRVNEETGCWEWAGAAARSGEKFVVPVAWWPAARRVVSVLRIAFSLTHAVPLGKRLVWRTCGCETCVNPKHLRAGTRKDWGVWVVKSRGARGVPIRKPRPKPENTKLSPRMAEEIRASNLTGSALAKQYGVSQTTISRVRLGRSFVTLHPQASVFSWRPT